MIKSDSKSGIDAIKAYLKGSLETKLKYGDRNSNEAADQLATAALKHDNIAINVHVTESVRYIISDNGDSICLSPREYISEIITDCVVSSVDYKYNLLHDEYHSISNDLWCDLSMQSFLTKARSNQLATNSKMNYWGNGKKSNVCTRCNNNSKEDQLHVFCECKDNDAIYNRTFKSIIELLDSSEHTNQVTRPYMIQVSHVRCTTSIVTNTTTIIYLMNIKLHAIDG